VSEDRPVQPSPVSRFSSVGLERRLQSWGVETIQCDLLDRASVNALPDVANVVFMAGMKFGSATQDARMTCSAGRA
jgi:hypothetical protein